MGSLTPLQSDSIKRLFAERGLSISEWARRHSFSPTLVYQVLDGERKCVRGQSHKIAVALGLKQGVSTEFEDLETELRFLSDRNRSRVL